MQFAGVQGHNRTRVGQVLHYLFDLSESSENHFLFRFPLWMRQRRNAAAVGMQYIRRSASKQRVLGTKLWFAVAALVAGERSPRHGTDHWPSRQARGPQVSGSTQPVCFVCQSTWLSRLQQQQQHTLTPQLRTAALACTTSKTFSYSYIRQVTPLLAAKKFAARAEYKVLGLGRDVAYVLGADRLL